MVISYDAAACQVWVDSLDRVGSGQLLCEQHRARLTPPRGWTVVDRREGIEPPLPPAPTAPVAEPDAVPPAVKKAPRRRARSWGHLDAPRLEFSGPEIEVTARSTAPVAVPAPEPPPEPEPEVVLATVEPAPEVEPPAPAPEPEPSAPEPEPEPEPEVVAPADDLADLLKPKGGLLGRAFQATGPQRSALTEVTPPDD